MRFIVRGESKMRHMFSNFGNYITPTLSGTHTLQFSAIRLYLKKIRADVMDGISPVP